MIKTNTIDNKLNLLFIYIHNIKIYMPMFWLLYIDDNDLYK